MTYIKYMFSTLHITSCTTSRITSRITSCITSRITSSIILHITLRIIIYLIIHVGVIAVYSVGLCEANDTEFRENLDGSDIDIDTDTEDLDRSLEKLLDKPQNTMPDRMQDTMQNLSDNADSNIKGAREYNDDNINNISGYKLNSSCKFMIINKLLPGSLDTLDMKINIPRSVGDLSVRMIKCYETSEMNKRSHFALVEVIDNSSKGDGRQIFYGWLSSLSKSLSAMEHPVYEIFLNNCD